MKRMFAKFWGRFKAFTYARLMTFRYGVRGGSSFGSAGAIIGVVLAVYVMAYTLPDAIVALSNASAYSGAGTAIINIATIVLPILVLFGCVLYLLPSEIKTKVGL